MNVGLTFLLSGDDVLQEVDRDLIVCRQVDTCIDREEVVALPLALVLGGELLRRDRLSLRWLILDLLDLIAFHIL